MNNYWENWEENFKKEFAERDLKNCKSGSIAYIKDIDKLTTWKIYHAHWEGYLFSSDYFKNWQEKINSFQTEKEVDFYTNRLEMFIEYVKENTRKEVNHVDENSPKQWEPKTTPKLIEQELKRLENISEEEFNKTYKWRKNGSVFKELSIKEMLNDPWFSKQLGFGSENKKDEERKQNSPVIINDNTDYKSWTKEQLISEINRLKTEIESLKNNQTLTISEKQKRLQQNQEKLEELEMKISVYPQPDINNPDNKFPTNWVIGGGLLFIIMLATFLVIKNQKKKKS